MFVSFIKLVHFSTSELLGCTTYFNPLENRFQDFQIILFGLKFVILEGLQIEAIVVRLVMLALLTIFLIYNHGAGVFFLNFIFNFLLKF